MAILDIVRLGHPALRLVSSEVSREEVASEGFQQFLDDLVETFSASSGVGIAAPQVGVNKRVIIVEVEKENPRYLGMPAFPQTIMINPVIESQSELFVEGQEGDLSFALRALVPRAASCTISGLDRMGKPVRFALSEPFHARVFQHEVDHLDGILFLDRVVRTESIAEQSEWDTYWKDATPYGRDSAWEQAALWLMKLTHELSAWASVVLVPNDARDALVCAAHYRLPGIWAGSENRLDSGSMNAQAFLEQREVIDNNGEVTSPPGSTADASSTEDAGVDQGEIGPIAASAVVLVPGVGTLEVLANNKGYRFDEQHLAKMRDAATRFAERFGRSTT